ncbi:uncharacterized protein LOC141631546 [Silene latifolia]|uniref:uncharacterized protein LOC141631546 n=1 Tax=Silene latifolia TaxID=37657 RepID=UPI003D781876
MRPEPRDCLLEPQFIHLGDLRVKDLYTSNWKWNVPLVNFLFKECSAKRILASPICQSKIKDEVFWLLTDDGTYTIKSGYGNIYERYLESKGSLKDRKRINENGKDFCRSRLWRLPGPSMWKILLWKIITNTLPVDKEFEKRKIGDNFMCRMCADGGSRLETLEHLFRDYSVSARIWEGSDLGIRGESATGINIGDWITNWIRFLSNLEEGEKRVLKFMATLWGIWLLRNNVIFRGVTVDPMTLFRSLSMSVEVSLKGLHLEEESRIKRQSSQELGFNALEKDLMALREGQPTFVIGNPAQCRGTRLKLDASWERNFDAACGWVA